MDIIIKAIPNKEISKREGFTGADWWFDKEGNLQVRVAKEINDWREECCLALHEMVEAIICKHVGVPTREVDDFDREYQKNHMVDLNGGDESNCPYRIPHSFATSAERMVAGVLNVFWNSYDRKIGGL